MTTNSLWILLLFFSFSVKSQDTIVYRNAGKLAVILKEVSQTEIKYQKVELPNGPMYVVNKNDIEKIIYKNGVIEILTPLTNYVMQSDPAEALKFRKLFYSDTKLPYKTLVELIDRYPDIKKKNEMYSYARSLKRLNTNKNGALGGAIAFGAATAGGIIVYAFADTFTNGGAEPEFSAPPVIFGVCAVALGALTVTFDICLRKKRKAFVNLYNE